MTTTPLEELSFVSTIAMGILALVAAAVAWHQIRVSHEDQKRATAKEIYRDYLQRAFENPKLSCPSHQTAYFSYKDISNDAEIFERYEWYVSCLLLAVEEILELEESEAWRETLKTQIKYHVEYLKSHREQIDSCSKSAKMFIESIIDPPDPPRDS